MRSQYRYTDICKFLLTPLREGRLSCVLNKPITNTISTHAPAGGATSSRTREENSGAISTHAPAGGATGNKGFMFRRKENFYSRPCGRGDVNTVESTPYSNNFYSRPCGRGDDVDYVGKQQLKISTHAPAGGATRNS